MVFRALFQGDHPHITLNMLRHSVYISETTGASTFHREGSKASPSTSTPAHDEDLGKTSHIIW